MALDGLGFASFAFTAGATAFFAPCSYPLLPGYLAYYLGTDDDGSTLHSRCRRAGNVALHVLVGFALVYIALGAAVAAAGTSALGDVVLLELLVGSALVAVGGTMALGRSVSTGGSWLPLPERRRSRTGYVLFGVCYAAAAAGCTAPLFLAVAGVSLSNGPVAAALGVGSYAAGMGTLMLCVTLLSALGRDALVSQLGGGWVDRAAGVLLVLAGLAQLYLFAFRYGGLDRLGLG